MAGSRLETIGSVFSRTRDLMRAGVLKEKPLWFDIYKAFPPLREPVFRRPRLRYGKAKAAIQDIFYHEDRIRAKFFSVYGSGHKAFDLFNPNFKSTCQRPNPGLGWAAWNCRFVEKYMELQDLGETDEEKLFMETGKALLAEGVILRRVREARKVSVRPQASPEGKQPPEDAQEPKTDASSP
ncbi:28S ribosomal protein S23, mitochondrial isoform X1 [Peromyscus leucopus]|uniref:28S ribosomal protein S23, mitochondrial isoform X1 n=1 Tax=Peromyscus leucopus TaxID=10041 RepID=UPI0018859192|nr:28S ribosomal protein S23, mitochondrial isoform X1 [Peromyscus leucopus]